MTNNVLCVGTALAFGTLVAVTLMPAIRAMSRKKRSVEQIFWLIYVAATLMLAVVVTALMRSLPMIGGTHTTSPSNFGFIWLVPTYVLLARALWRLNKKD